MGTGAPKSIRPGASDPGDVAGPASAPSGAVEALLPFIQKVVHRLKGSLFALSSELQVALPDGNEALLERTLQGLAGISASLTPLTQLESPPPVLSDWELSRDLDMLLAAEDAMMAARGIRLARDFSPTAPAVKTDATYVETILQHLLHNAAAHATCGAEIRVQAVVQEDAWQLSVIDPGPPIDPEVRRRMFDPFYSTRPRAWGIGLSIARARAARLGATLEHQETAEGGNAFVARFPRQGV